MLKLTQTLFAIATAVAILIGGPALAQKTLTAAQMEGFLKAYKETQTLSQNPGPQARSALEAVVKKNGFKDFVEFGTAAEVIAAVLAAMDPGTKQYNDPGAILRGEIARIQADTGIGPAEKKQMTDAINEGLKALPPLPPKENIELVTRYYDRLVAVMQ
jgi:hypothetical protein